MAEGMLKDEFLLAMATDIGLVTEIGSRTDLDAAIFTVAYISKASVRRLAYSPEQYVYKEHRDPIRPRIKRASKPNRKKDQDDPQSQDNGSE